MNNKIIEIIQIFCWLFLILIIGTFKGVVIFKYGYGTYFWITEALSLLSIIGVIFMLRTKYRRVKR